MNKRGQAALEYLMTYGWALIVIAIVVGVLVFIVSSPTGDIVCSSSDPAKMSVKASKIAKNPGAAQADFGEIIVTNLTGGTVTGITTTPALVTGAFLGNTAATLDLASSYVSGQEIRLKPNELTTVIGTHPTSIAGFTYLDYSGFSRDVNITCSGPIVTQ